jgi:hypothetical protein
MLFWSLVPTDLRMPPSTCLLPGLFWCYFLSPNSLTDHHTKIAVHSVVSLSLTLSPHPIDVVALPLDPASGEIPLILLSLTTRAWDHPHRQRWRWARYLVVLSDDIFSAPDLKNGFLRVSGAFPPHFRLWLSLEHLIKPLLFFFSLLHCCVLYWSEEEYGQVCGRLGLSGLENYYFFLEIWWAGPWSFGT